GPDAMDVSTIKSLCQETGLKIAAVGTGAGMVIHQLSLTSPDAEVRQRAHDFVVSMINFGGEFGTPAIIGSMQGRWTPDVGKEATLQLLADQLSSLGEAAKQAGTPLVYEPLNRYETNLCNTMADGVRLIENHEIPHVVLLADLFHMNIEETSIAQGLRDGGGHIGHVHFVDSNRRPAGCGHMDYTPIAVALKEIGYNGYASAEAFPWPDPDQAAQKTIETYRKVFG
ncbi:MAG: sugar phosphate isomerase/epimerase, partial [Planctomycetaceae bacterium]|nr:sugar phosphate isomerase/epimerase [Planctomycetaceae bacterium]